MPLLKSSVAVSLAKHGLRTRLMKTRVEYELATVLGEVRQVSRPTGDHLGETHHVILGVAGAHAKRMQLEYLAAEILIQTCDRG